AAPSLVCLNKDKGELLWKDNSPGENILMTQFADPTIVKIGGEFQVIVPQSDGWIRAFRPESGEKLWEFDINPKVSSYKIGGRGDRNYLLGNAVVYDDRVYIASGRFMEEGEGPGRLVCIDPTKRGDVSSELAVDADGKRLPRRRLQAVDPQRGEKAIPNPNSALVWEFAGPPKTSTDGMQRTCATVAIAKGLVIAVDLSGQVHCLNAKTGQPYWHHDMLTAIVASPLIVDDKVYVGNEDGVMSVFQLVADPKCAEPLATIPLGNPLYASPVYANGTLYIANRNTLFAVDATAASRWHEQAGNWPQWRGPDRSNRSEDVGLLQKWPDGGPPLSWRVDGLGDGIASIAMADGRIFTSTTYGENEFAVALDEETGQRLWATRVGAAVPENPLMRWLSQRTPTVDGNRLYVFTNSAWLVCLDAISGEVVWRISYSSEFGTRPGTWGLCDRPLVDGDKLICAPGGTQATVVALDKRTGKVIWRKLLDGHERNQFAATLVVQTSGLKQYVVYLTTGLASFAADDGRLLWRYDRRFNLANSYTPLIIEGGLLSPNGYNTGIARLKLTRKDDTVAVEQQYYKNVPLVPFADSSVLVDDRLYAFKGTRDGPLVCIDSSDSKDLWTARGSGSGKAAATYADGRLYLRWVDGTVALVEDSPKAYVETGHFKLPDARNSMGCTLPVVAGGHLYVRDNDRLYCYDVRQHPTGALPPKPVVVLWSPATYTDPQPRLPGQAVPNAIFVPTPQDVVAKMLEAAHVGKNDVVYDLGSGDGRILIEAAKKYQCKAIGVEIDPDLVTLSRKRVEEARLEKLVAIRQADIFAADFGDATVVTVYLFPDLLKRLMPKFEKLKPGTRIVSHQFPIPDFPPEKTITVESVETGAKHTVYLWTMPLRK
ncbi:MAG: PQQ-binding-like beta-propeller repeat protein, partial [Thermoguttaceae bacterium]